MRSLLSQSQTPTVPRRTVGFFRFGRPPSCLGWLITQPTSDWPSFILGQPFQPSTHAKVNAALINVNAAFRCRLWVFSAISGALQMLAGWVLKENEISLSRLFHIRFTVLY